MSSIGHLLLAVAAAATAAGCLPQSDLDEYSRDWTGAVNADVGTGVDTLQEDPPADDDPSPPSNTEGDGTTPGTDGNPDDPTLSNPDPDVSEGSSGNETPSEETPSEETPEDPPPPPPNPCGSDIANAAGTTCYFVSTEAVAWPEARTACVAWGGDLAVMDAPFEDAFVSTLTTESVWIGASDIAFDNAFTWVSGPPVANGFGSNWGPAQPDRFPGQDCIEKRQEQLNERWYDQPCVSPFRFVCEKPVPEQQPAQ
jgi:hypothetical protein